MNRRLAETRTERRAEVENYVGVALTDEQREKLQHLVDVTPVKSEEEVTALALELGVDRLLDANDELDRLADEELADEPTAQEEVALLARAFQVREELKTPSSITVSLSTMDRYAVDQLVAATGMKLDDIVKMIVAKGIAALMKENGVEQVKPKTTFDSGTRSVPRMQ